MSAYIERDLWGKSEFKSHINRITVDVRSSSTHPTTTYLHFHHLDLPSTTRDNPASGPSPLLRDVGPNLHSSAYSESRPLASAPPLSRGMWAAQAHSMEESGREKHKWGPKEWEAHLVRLNDEPRWKSWFVFFISSSIPSNWPLHPTPAWQPTSGWREPNAGLGTTTRPWKWHRHRQWRQQRHRWKSSMTSHHHPPPYSAMTASDRCRVE